MPTSNPANVPTAGPTDRYVGAQGTPVEADRTKTIGSGNQLFGNKNAPTEVDYGAKGKPINRD